MPDQFSTADVDRLARLARLALTQEEKTLFARQLSDILAYAEQIRAVDTEGIPATSHPSVTASPMRDDQVQPSLTRDEVLSAAPEADTAAGLFKVPRVLG